MLAKGTVKFDGWVFPEYEAHLQNWMCNTNMRRHGRLTYQAHKYDYAKRLCKQHRVAVDIGGHVGLWSFLIAHDFETLHAFEPMHLHGKCWRENMKGMDNANLHECALGSGDGYVMLETRTHDSSGDTGVTEFSNEPKSGYVPMYQLDKYEFNNVDFIKIDCEGYELNVLKGAEKTLLRCKPVVVVEQKRDMSMRYGIPSIAAVDYLKLLGATLMTEISGDYILAWA